MPDGHDIQLWSNSQLWCILPPLAERSGYLSTISRTATVPVTEDTCKADGSNSRSQFQQSPWAGKDQKSSPNVWIKWSNWMNNKRTAPSSISGAKPPTKTVLCGFGTWVLSLQDFREITCEFGLVCLSLWISLGNRSSKIMALTSSMSGSLTGGLRSDAIGSTVTAWPPKACRSGTSGPHSVCSHLTPWHLNGSSSYNRLAVDDI